jgi:hypothetical protein
LLIFSERVVDLLDRILAFVLQVGTEVNCDMELISEDFGANARGYVDTRMLAEVRTLERIQSLLSWQIILDRTKYNLARVFL